jgi:carbon-monoxide dehydrogenase large subunit
VLVLWAARRLGRPVKWTADRGESFLADHHGRDQVTEAALALDRDGRFLGLKAETIGNLGAHLSKNGPRIPSEAGSYMYASVYTTPAVYFRARCVFTNTTPVDAYRGAGRPEANFVVERLIDTAARELGITPEALRRRNFIGRDAFPYTTALGLTYDGGDFAGTMDKALGLADRTGFAERRAAARRRGRLRGFGLSYYLHACARGPTETAALRFEDDDTVTLLIGTQCNGQGHETVFAQIVADELGLPFERVNLAQGDSDALAHGGGTGGSWSVLQGGAAIGRAARQSIDKGREVAAEVLEAAPADIVFDDGRFTVVGTDRGVDLFDVARQARSRREDGGLDGTGSFANADFTFTNGCHVAEVEVDPETGHVDLVGFTVVDDVGRVINPPLLAGQVHGGCAQGIGQALLEGCVYDDASGQLLTGSFLDYCLPRADDLPAFRFETNNVPCTTNPLGIKGAGEAGAVGAPPAIINAVVDALADHGVRHVDMPATPERVWRALNQAGSGR